MPEYNELEDEYWLEERLWGATQYNSTSAAGGPDTSSLAATAAANPPHAIPQSTTDTLLRLPIIRPALLQHLVLAKQVAEITSNLLHHISIGGALPFVLIRFLSQSKASWIV